MRALDEALDDCLRALGVSPPRAASEPDADVSVEALQLAPVRASARGVPPASSSALLSAVLADDDASAA